MPVGTAGNFLRTFINGFEVTGDQSQLSYGHIFGDNKVPSQNTGVEAHSPGAFDPTLSQNGLAKRGSAAITAHNLLFPSGLGGANDTEYIITQALGVNAAPIAGQDYAVCFDGTEMDYQRQNTPGGNMTFQAPFKSRGKRMPPFPVFLYDNAAIKTATNFSSTPYDDGVESNGTSYGGVGVLQVYTPTGTAATGNIQVPTQPVAADTVVVNGTTYTWRAALTPAANEVLIGATALASAQNLYAALTGGEGAGTTYAAGTTSFSQYLLSATVFIAPPTGGSNTINITYATTGTAGNSFTLAKTGTGGLTVSGATLSGGVAGDQYTIALASSTSSGGAYTTHITWSNVGNTRTAIRTEIAIGTVINEWLKLTFTLSSGAGTSQTFAANVCFGRFFQL